MNGCIAAVCVNAQFGLHFAFFFWPSGLKALHIESVVRSNTLTLSTPCKSMHLCMKRSSPHASIPVSFSFPFQFKAFSQSSRFAKKVLKP